MTVPSRNPREAAVRRDGPPWRHGSDETTFDLTDYARMLHRRRWAAVVAFLILAVPPLLLTFTADNVYASKARVRVGVPLPDVGDRPQSPTRSGINDYVELFRSRRVARLALEELRLSNPPFERTPNLIAALRDIIATYRPASEH